MGISETDFVVGSNVVEGPLVQKASGYDAFVLDVRGCRYFTPFFAAGTQGYQACDEEGTVLTGSSSANFTTATEVTVVAPFYKVTASVAGALVIAKV